MISLRLSITLIAFLLFSALNSIAADSIAGDISEATAKGQFLNSLQAESEAKIQEIEAKLPEAERAPFRAAFTRGLAVFIDKTYAIKGPLVRNSALVALITPTSAVLDYAIIGALYATGNWKLATIVATVPATLILDAGGIVVSESLDTYRVARALGIEYQPWKLLVLMRERRRILNAMNANHLLTVMFKAQQEEAERAIPVRIVRGINQAMWEHSDVYLSRNKLEELIRKHKGGEEFLRSSGDLIGYTQLYVASLLAYIDKYPEIKDQYAKIVEAEINEKAGITPGRKGVVRIRKQLHAINDTRARIAHLGNEFGLEQERLGITMLNNLKRAALGIDDGDLRALAGVVKRMREKIDQNYRDLRHLEYAQLYKQTYGGAPKLAPNSGKAGMWDTAARIEYLKKEERKMVRMLKKLRAASQVPGALHGDVAKVLAAERAIFGVPEELQLKPEGKLLSGYGAVIRGCRESYAGLVKYLKP